MAPKRPAHCQFPNQGRSPLPLVAPAVRPPQPQKPRTAQQSLTQAPGQHQSALRGRSCTTALQPRASQTFTRSAR